MKRVLSFLVVLCLILGVIPVAMAASVTITQQPTSQTVKAGGTVTLTLKAKNAAGQPTTWYFTNPVTGETTTGKKLSSVVKGVTVKGPNSLKITLRKVPEEMHGWTAYCHIGNKNGGVTSDTVMILIAGLEPPAMPVSTGTASGSVSSVAAATDGEGTAAVSTIVTADPEPIVISGSKVELYNLDKSGQMTGEPQTELSFKAGTSANFYVKLPEGTEGTIQYLTVDGVRFTPDVEVTGMSIRGLDHSATVKVKVNRPEGEHSASNDTMAELAALQQQKEEQMMDASLSPMATVTCTYCRFTGGGNTFAESGQVPVGTTITVFSAGGMIGIRNSEGNYTKKSGYFINGDKTSVHRGEASFQMVVEGDTTITMNKQ